MNQKILRLAQAIKQNASADCPTTINPDCSVSDIREQSGLSESEFHDAIQELKAYGMIILSYGNSEIVDIQLTKEFDI